MIQYTNEITCRNYTPEEVAGLAMEAAKRGDKLIIIDPEKLANWLEELDAARKAIYNVRVATANFDL